LFQTRRFEQRGVMRALLADGEHDAVKGPLGLEPVAQGSLQMLVESAGQLGRANPERNI
jgi:hypothetical protein